MQSPSRICHLLTIWYAVEHCTNLQGRKTSWWAGWHMRGGGRGMSSITQRCLRKNFGWKWKYLGDSHRCGPTPRKTLWQLVYYHFSFFLLPLYSLNVLGFMLFSEFEHFTLSFFLLSLEHNIFLALSLS